MKALVSAASEHRATTEVAREIGGALREALNAHRGEGEEETVVEVLRSEHVDSVEPYEPW